MRVYSLNELFRLTRNELFALHAETVAELNRLPEASPDRVVGFENLRNIRRVIAKIRLVP